METDNDQWAKSVFHKDLNTDAVNFNYNNSWEKKKDKPQKNLCFSFN